MKVAVFVKATKDSEAGVLPTRELLEAMGKFNEELVKSGVILAAEGLQPSSRGVRVRISGKNRTVVSGPFAETNELVAGFWIWKVGSLEEAIEWVKRCPNPMLEDSDIEIRALHSVEDFGDAATPEFREREKRFRQQVESARAGSVGATSAPAELAPARFEKCGQRIIAGINRSYTPKSAAGIAEQWQEAVPKLGGVDGQVGKATYGIVWNHRPDCAFDYLCGVEVREGAKLPVGFSPVRLPAAEYAVFEHPGHVSSIAQTIERVQSEWLPASQFERAAPIIFERYTEKFNPETHSGGIEIWLPVRSKA